MQIQVPCISAQGHGESSVHPEGYNEGLAWGYMGTSLNQTAAASTPSPSEE